MQSQPMHDFAEYWPDTPILTPSGVCFDTSKCNHICYCIFILYLFF